MNLCTSLRLLCSLVLVPGVLAMGGCAGDSSSDEGDSNGTAGTSNGTTVPDGTCTQDDDCQGSQVCGEGLCREMCQPGNPCVIPNTVCKAELGYCVERECTTTANCNAGFSCNGGFCVLDPNRCNPECGTGQVCMRGECVADPNARCEPACGVGELCVGGSCVPDPDFVPCDPPCGRDETCEEGMCVLHVATRCAVAGERCDETTTENSDTLVCTVVDNRDLERMTCEVLCESNDDCDAGTFCARLGTTRPFVCLPSNCTGFFTPSDCDDVGDNGGNCVQYANETWFCEPAGPVGPGRACNQNNNNTACGPGLLCVGGTCEAPCPLGGDTCEDGTACIDLVSVPGAGLCRVSCGGFEGQGDCPAGFGCLPFGTADEGYCIPAGNIAAGEPCEDDTNGCEPGTVCRRFTEEDELRCRPLCDRTAPSFGDDTCAREMELCGDLNGVAGTCFPSCTPFVAETGCTEEGMLFCLPFEDGTRGTCFPSGAAATGDACNLIEGSFLGMCDPGNVCVPDDFEDDASPGTCFPACDRSAPGFGDDTCAVEDDICLGLTTLVGYCDHGCTPFVDAATNGCDTPGEGFCFPLESYDRGRCSRSGNPGTPVGEPCAFGDDSSFLGDCDANGVCVPNDFNDLSRGGICRSTCPTFSSVYEFDTTCDTTTEVCDFFTSLDWGVCTNEVLSQRLEPFEPCPESGKYCDEDVYCIQVDQQGNNLCIPFCRLGRGDEDCPQDVMGPLGCEQVFTSTTLGVCLPP